MAKLQKIALHGVPRSGTTWLGSILDSSPNVAYRFQPLFSYGHKSFLNENSSIDDINIFFENILNTNDDFVLQKDAIKKGLVPAFKKENITHIVYKEVRYHHIIQNLLEKDNNIKVIGIVRNPKSVISSWYNAPKEFKKDEWNLMEEWKYANKKNLNRKEEFNGYIKWKEVANLFLQLKENYPDRFLLVKYDTLLNETINTINELFDFCRLELTGQTMDFINDSQKKDFSKDAYAVYRSNQTDDKWKTSLPQEIIKEIDKDLSGTILEKFIENDSH